MKEEIDYIYGIPKFVKKASLDNTRELLRRLGNPETGMKIIHVAGTNGKGSVCAYLDRILRETGRTVGRFTSPHLVDIRERICLNGKPVSEAEFEEAFARVKEIALSMQEEGFSHPSFFEFLFGMGMYCFGRQKPDYVILEVGLGGRLDATNAIAAPILSIITSISLDHTEILGDTYEAIAGEKAGIIKTGVPVIFEDAREDVTRTILGQAVRRKAPAVFFSADEVRVLSVGDNSVDFSLCNGYYDNECFCVQTQGIYQAENASLVLLACKELGITDCDVIRRGLMKTAWMGRMQRVERDLVVDGAHNDDGIARFLESVSRDKRTHRTLLFSAVADKHYEGMIGEIVRSGLFEDIEAAVLADGRALSRERMEQTFAGYPDQEVHFHDSVKEALECVRTKRDEGSMAYVAGSLYLAGEVLGLIGVDYD